VTSAATSAKVGVWSLSAHHVAIGIALHEARAGEFDQTLQHTGRVVSDGDQVTQHEVSVDTALRLDIREHRVQSDGIAATSQSLLAAYDEAFTTAGITRFNPTT